MWGHHADIRALRAEVIALRTEMAAHERDCHAREQEMREKIGAAHRHIRKTADVIRTEMQPRIAVPQLTTRRGKAIAIGAAGALLALLGKLVEHAPAILAEVTRLIGAMG